jgi:hypothetical protein
VIPDPLLVPIIVGLALLAVVLIAWAFLSRSAPAAADSGPGEPATDDGDSWYFLKFEPGNPPADLSHP